MKTSALLAGLAVCGSTTAHAFTVDFSSHLGSSTTYILGDLDPGPPSLVPIVVNVPGYGDVEFQILRSVDSGPQLSGESYRSTVTTEFTNEAPEPIPALGFSDQTRVEVTFKGDLPINIDFDYVGVGLGEDFALSNGTPPDGNHIVIDFSSIAGPTPSGGPNQAGLRSISFEAVPEPSSALLGGIALLGLLRRKR
ncbi:MAG: PEP-CTERM sorting domain-containing protein [Verrucomicrobiaceae bacterium]